MLSTSVYRSTNGPQDKEAGAKVVFRLNAAVHSQSGLAGLALIKLMGLCQVNSAAQSVLASFPRIPWTILDTR